MLKIAVAKRLGRFQLNVAFEGASDGVTSTSSPAAAPAVSSSGMAEARFAGGEAKSAEGSGV